MTVAVYIGHVLSDLVPHAPGALVGHAKLSLEFLSRNAMPGRGEQVHRVEPLLEWSLGLFKRGARHWMKVMTAPLADVGRHLGQPVELGTLLTLRAIGHWPETHHHEMV